LLYPFNAFLHNNSGSVLKAGYRSPISERTQRFFPAKEDYPFSKPMMFGFSSFRACSGVGYAATLINLRREHSSPTNISFKFYARIGICGWKKFNLMILMIYSGKGFNTGSERIGSCC